MLKTIEITAATVQQVAQPLPEKVMNFVFKMMHGFYGTLFLSKYSSGLVDPAGKDLGIQSARKVWAHGLREFDESVLIEAMGRCKTKHVEFPPSLPQFVVLCQQSLPPKLYISAAPAIGMGQQLRSSYARRARETIARKTAEALERNSGRVNVPQGLDGLKQAIADAVRCAGGDEAQELVRLDSILPTVAA